MLESLHKWGVVLDKKFSWNGLVYSLGSLFVVGSGWNESECSMRTRSRLPTTGPNPLAVSCQQWVLLNRFFFFSFGKKNLDANISPSWPSLQVKDILHFLHSSYLDKLLVQQQYTATCRKDLCSIWHQESERRLPYQTNLQMKYSL